jgi:ATP-dependent helicase Lhr and Lhr-like helicase
LSSVYHSLHPELQRAIVQGAGWRELRPIQELALPPIVAGDNCLVLAPTAGGKTEAALLPTLEVLLRERKAGLRVLYVCPLKALLNNQFLRLSRWAGWVGMDVFLWHGDTGSADRQRFLRQPTEILMTTPESLEVLLSSCGPRGRGTLWENLRMVIVDEIHAFAGEERGDHLACLLERLTQGRDLQRVGLSATVGNPQNLLHWLQGSSRRQARLIDPGKVKSKKLIEVHPWEEEAHRHLQVARLTASGKSLVFVDSRRKAEELVQSLQAAGQCCFLHHASLSEEARRGAENAFQSSPQACIVCTSTMELGLDVGDLDRVVQVGSPNTVGSFLQRLGRSGRRDRPAHMAFVTDEHWSFLQSCALLQLARQNYVEPLQPSRRSLAVFAQQTLVRALADGGVSEEQLLSDAAAFCFGDVRREEKIQIFDHLCAQGLLERSDARLVLGENSERKLGGSGFIELYSVFASAHQYQVVTTGGKSVGQLDAWFAWSLRGQTEASFALGGCHWTILDIDKERSQVIVEIAPGGSLPQWHGPPRLLGRRLCGAIRDLLRGDDEIPFLDSKGARLLSGLRESWQVRLQQAAVNLEIRAQGQRLYTFAGGKINQVLSLVWQQVHRIKPTFNNFYLHFSEDFGDLESVMRRLQDPAPLELGALLPPLQLNKFQQFLPPELERIYRAERLLDEEGARSLAVDAWSIVELAGAR